MLNTPSLYPVAKGCLHSAPILLAFFHEIGPILKIKYISQKIYLLVLLRATGSGPVMQMGCGGAGIYLGKQCTTSWLQATTQGKEEVYAPDLDSWCCELHKKDALFYETGLGLGLEGAEVWESLFFVILFSTSCIPQILTSFLLLAEEPCTFLLELVEMES